MGPMVAKFLLSPAVFLRNDASNDRYPGKINQTSVIRRYGDDGVKNA